MSAQRQAEAKDATILEQKRRQGLASTVLTGGDGSAPEKKTTLG